MVGYDSLGSGIGVVLEGGWVLLVATNGLENFVVGN